MSTMTVLEMVQEILSAMDSEEVDSISDTTESYQVAVLLRGVYYDVINDLNLPEHDTIFELNASGSVSKPTLMTVPDAIVKVYDIKYNNKLTADTYSNYQDVTYLTFDEFLNRAQGLREQTSDVGQMTFVNSASESFEVMYRTDKMPQYWTSFDDHTLLFDSYDSDEDTTLQKSKTMCKGKKLPTFTLSDTFTPTMDAPQFRYFLNKAKVRAFNELKQQINQEAVAEAKRQKNVAFNRKRTVPGLRPIDLLPRYGRRTQGYTTQIRQDMKKGE